MQLPARHSGFTMIEMMISIAVLAVLTAIAIPALGTLFSRNQTKAAAVLFRDDLRQARYESRTQSGSSITFCAANSDKTTLGCDTASGFEYGWLWYLGGTLDSSSLLGESYSVNDNDVPVSVSANFSIELRKGNTLLSSPSPSITFGDASDRTSVITFDATGRTHLEHY